MCSSFIGNKRQGVVLFRAKSNGLSPRLTADPAGSSEPLSIVLAESPGRHFPAGNGHRTGRGFGMGESKAARESSNALTHVDQPKSEDANRLVSDVVIFFSPFM